MANQPDFRGQKGKLEEELNKLKIGVLFYPKFDCEVNFIDRFWSLTKYYARLNCKYSLEELRKTEPEAICSVELRTSFRYYVRCDRVILTYSKDHGYGT